MERPWRHELNGYHWFVLIVAALGWLFDCLDQQLFILARQPAIADLVAISDPKELKTAVDSLSAYATSIFLVGWATGGLFFGVLGDRIGRAKTMMITILMYSLFTGLSAFSVSFVDFALYRFLTGLGVGGEFAVGVSLVAEVMPERARPYALGLLQSLSAVGNVSAALINMAVGSLAQQGLVGSVWRPLFVVGALPALLVLVIRTRLKEPEQWRAVAERKKQSVSQSGTEPLSSTMPKLGSYRELFGDPRWRRNAFVGLGLAFSGVVGLWAIAFFTMDLVGNILTSRFQARGMTDQEITGNVVYWKSITSLMLNAGAFLGMYCFGPLTQRVGRRQAFALAFLASLLSTVAVFALLREFWHILVLVPLMGFCQLSLFAGYAIYFPELFPTHLRSTGTSFCYNVGRFVAAIGPLALGLLTQQVFAHTDEPLRYAGLTMCSIFIIGLCVLPFAPETKGKPLPT